MPQGSEVDAVALRRELRQRRWQTRDRVTAEAAAGLASLLTRDQAVRAYLLAFGEASPEEVRSAALLDPWSRFVLPEDSREPFRNEVLAQVSAREWEESASVGLPELGSLRVWDRTAVTAFRLYSLKVGVQGTLDNPDGIVTWHAPAGGPVYGCLWVDRGPSCVAHPGAIPAWLATRSNPAERTAALKPLARRLIFSTQWRTVLEMRLAGRATR